MKILIWALSILITSIVAVVIKSAGITLGAIPTMILYAPLFFITPKLCKKWDEHKANKSIHSEHNVDRFTKNIMPQNNVPANAPAQSAFHSCPQALTITDIDNLSNYYGRFVKLEIKGLENTKAFKLRNPGFLRSASEEAISKILTAPISELWYQTLREDICVKIEPISVITTISYEEKHCIYGILHKRPGKRYILANAFVIPSSSHTQVIAHALKTQGMFEYTVLDDGTLSVFDFISEQVEHLEIPEKIDGKVVTAISSHAFSDNQTIKTLKIPDSVKTIEYSFPNCNNLESVYLGDGVESVYAFDCCKKLKNVYLGKSISDVEHSFHNCHELTAFKIAPDNAHLCEVDGVLFSKDKKALILCPCGKKGTYIIPSGTKIIGSSAFENSDLEEIVIANTVETLEVCAFAYTAGMKKLTIPSSVVEIEYEAISPGIKEIVIEQGSYAQQYFEGLGKDRYNLTVVDKLPTIDANVSTPVSGSDKLFCRRCGAQLPIDSDFCFKCGTKVEK